MNFCKKEKGSGSYPPKLAEIGIDSDILEIKELAFAPDIVGATASEGGGGGTVTSGLV